MATTGEVQVGCNKADDNVHINEEKNTIATIQDDANFPSGGAIDLVISRTEGDTEYKFSLQSLLAKLKNDDGAETTYIDAFQTLIKTLIGSDDVTPDTLRKNLKDWYDQYEADIALI